jgi:hypothetical protein
MTTKHLLIDDLRTRPQIGGHFVTSASPSATSMSIMWPDRHVQTVELAGGTTIAKRDSGEECHIYRRGPEYQMIVSEIDAELQRQEDEVQDVVAELKVESDNRIAGIMAGDNVTIVKDDPQPMSQLCAYEAPHYDCESCPDTKTNESPKHHLTAAAFAGHKRSNLHKRNSSSASEKAEA